MMQTDTHYNEIQRTRAAIADALHATATRLCKRMEANRDAPTCRSPVLGEALHRASWCHVCLAREAQALLDETGWE